MLAHLAVLAVLLVAALSEDVNVMVDSSGTATRAAPGEEPVTYCPCVMVDRWNRRTQLHERWCVPVPHRWSWLPANDFEAHEAQQGYGPGGFHPTLRGDLFDNGRYRVVRRLGSGAFATVWVAQDLHNDGIEVALKITQANSTRMANDEIAMLPLIRHPNVIELLANFTFQGIFGTHVALVYPLLGRDVRADAVGARKGVNAARDVARGVLRALVEINKHGIIHADIKVTRSLTRASILPDAHHHGRVRAPMCEHGTRVPSLGLTMFAVENILWRDGREDDVVLGDFGGAYFLKDLEQSTSIQSREYRAPEVIIKADIGYAVDVWSMACAVYEVATGEILFSPRKDDRDLTNIRHLALFVELLGDFSPEFVARGRRGHKFFHPNGTMLVPQPAPLSLAALLKDDFSIDDPLFADFLLSALTLDPLLRPTPAKLLRHMWLRTAGGPDVVFEDEGVDTAAQQPPTPEEAPAVDASAQPAAEGEAEGGQDEQPVEEGDSEGSADDADALSDDAPDGEQQEETVPEGETEAEPEPEEDGDASDAPPSDGEPGAAAPPAVTHDEL